MIIIINHRNTPIYTKRQQAKALTTVANLIDKLQTAIHHYCRREITTSWKSWIKTCHDEANALTERHDAMTKAIFVQLTRVIAQCQQKRHGKVQLLYNPRQRTQGNNPNPELQRTPTKEAHAKQNHDPQTPKIQSLTHNPIRNVSIKYSYKKHPNRSC